MYISKNYGGTQKNDEVKILKSRNDPFKHEVNYSRYFFIEEE